MMTPTSIQVLAFIGVLGAAIAAGGQLMALTVIIPAIRRWPAGMSLKTHQVMLDRLPDRYLPYCTGASLLAAAAILALNRRLPTSSAGLIFVGLLATIGVVIISVAFTMPLSKVMSTWSSDSVPATYPQVRNRWDRMHALRTVLGTGAFVCYLTAGLAL